jgi:hypothetical protein
MPQPLTSVEQIQEHSKRRFYHDISIVGILSSTIWPVVMVIFNLGDPYIFANFICAVFSLIMFLYIRSGRSLKYVNVITTVVSVTTLLLIGYINGGGKETSDLFYIFLFPIFSFFIWGKKMGLGLTLVYVFAVALLSVFHPLFPSLVIYQLFFVAACMVYMLYFYQEKIDDSQKLLTVRGHQLQDAVNQLESEVESRKLTEEKLAKNVKELQNEKAEVEKLNKFMVDRELTMIKLKEKIKELENRTQ